MTIERADIAVVGLGLIGAATLRHLADRQPDASIVGIGSTEPANLAAHEGVFASHYDSGRITRRLDRRWEWSVLASRAIAGYPEIEARSGIRFHRPTGVVFCDSAAGVAALVSVADLLGVSYDVGPIATTGQPDERLRFAAASHVLREPAPAGHIDPRRLITAQLAIAATMRATVQRAEARRIERRGAHWAILDADNQLLSEATIVVIAVGPHTDELDGLPVIPKLRVHRETVVMAHLGSAEARRLAGIPAGISVIDHPIYEDFYYVPPTDYPDGSVRLKMGATMHDLIDLHTAADRRGWMRGSCHRDELPAIRALIEELVPGIAADRWESTPCMITETPTRLPYLDIIGDGLVVAAGGNGYAAKSSDAIGAIAAGLALDGRWTDAELDADDFQVIIAA